MAPIASNGRAQLATLLATGGIASDVASYGGRCQLRANAEFCQFLFFLNWYNEGMRRPNLSISAHDIPCLSRKHPAFFQIFSRTPSWVAAAESTFFCLSQLAASSQPGNVNHNFVCFFAHEKKSLKTSLSLTKQEVLVSCAPLKVEFLRFNLSYTSSIVVVVRLQGCQPIIMVNNTSPISFTFCRAMAGRQPGSTNIRRQAASSDESTRIHFRLDEADIETVVSEFHQYRLQNGIAAQLYFKEDGNDMPGVFVQWRIFPSGGKVPWDCKDDCNASLQRSG